MSVACSGSKNKTAVTVYDVGEGSRTLRAAVAADLHNSPYDNIVPLISSASPDVILVPGDLCGLLIDPGKKVNNISQKYIREAQNNRVGFGFLESMKDIAPVFCSVGNHEVAVSEENRTRFADAGALLLDNGYADFGDFVIGGLTTGGSNGLWGKSNPPDTEWLNSFSRLDGRKILLCHHPEYWEDFIVGKGIFLTVAGHAHGGQWRFFGRGVLAPGQGLFPRYTSGLHCRNDEFLAVSRGLGNHCAIPRINNPPEIVILNIHF